MINEVWKPIEGFEGKYEVSNLGNIKSLPRDYFYGKVKEETYLRLYKEYDGYLRVTLFKNGIRHRYHVHRLVAKTFVENPLNKPFVNHLNEIKDDNRAENLEWCTSKENSNWGACRNKISEKVSKPIKQYDALGKFIRDWKSITQASNSLGISISSLSECLHGRTNTSKGYKWRFANEVDK